MRKAAGFVDGTQVSRIRRILEHNASADDEDMMGVNYDRKRRKWQATLIFQGIRHRLGSYDTPRESATARKKAEQAWFGAYWETFPPKDEKTHR